MSNEDINRIVGEYHGVLPFQIYAIISDSPQIDHIKRDGDYWRIQVIPG